jgi:acetyl esterase/lipase
MTTGTPPLDRELAGPLRQILTDLPSMTADQIPARRLRARDYGLTDELIRRDGAFELEWLDITGHAGEEGVRLLACRPARLPGPWPVILNIHGGGMVAGSARGADLVDDLVRAEALHLAVIAVEYRLAPEHPDPVPVEDCYAALCWVAAHRDQLGIDPDRIVLSGNSAGGGLAAGVALLARDRGGPRPLGQLLQCPMLDDRCGTESARQMEHVGLWNTVSNRTGWDALLGDRRGGPHVSAYAAPARAEDLAGLPPAFIDVGGVECLRDEAISYALALSRAGVPTELHLWSGGFHSFDQWVPGAAVSRAARAARLSWLGRLLAPARGTA